MVHTLKEFSDAAMKFVFSIITVYLPKSDEIVETESIHQAPTIPETLLIHKFVRQINGMSPLSINMIFSYLNNRTHRTKINECFSERSGIEHGVPQDLILGPLLFNINLIDLFYECEESSIASYADDTTPYSCA